MGEIDMSGSENLPKQGKSQKIGQFAIAAFNANHPLEWLTTATDGDTDFGLDFQVQLVHEGLVSNLFHAQVKSTQQVDKNGRCEDLSADGKSYSVTLNISTLNYYANIASPVLLVFADLSTDPNPRQCKTYYKWIDDELDDLLAGKQNLDHLGKESHTFRIPSENILNPDFNAQPYLAERARQKKALRELAGVVSEKTSDPVAVITTLSQTLRFKPGTIDAISFESDNPWIDCAPGSTSALLERSQHLLASLNLEQAEAILAEASAREAEMSTHEKAELKWQQGKLTYHKALDSTCMPYFESAFELLPENKKYKRTVLELKIHFDFRDQQTCEAVLEEIKSETDTLFVLFKCRLLAHLSRIDEALACVETVKDNEASVVKAQILFMDSRFDECIAFASEKLKDPNLSIGDQLQLRIFLGRSFYHLGTKQPQGPGYETQVPTYGYADMDQALLERSWEQLVLGWGLGRTLNFHPLCEFLIDVSAILSNYFNRTTDFENFIREYAHKRPKSESTLRVLYQTHVLKGSKKDFELFKEHFPDGLEKTIRMVMYHYSQHENLEVVRLVSENLEALSSSSEYQSTAVLSLGLQGATDLGLASEKNRILKALESKPNFEIFTAINERANLVEADPSSIAASNEKLYSLFKAGSRDHQLVSVLITALDPSDQTNSERVVEVSKVISGMRSLAFFEVRKVCSAYYTLSDWDSLLAYADEALKRFPKAGDLLFFKALALENFGRTPEALAVFDGISPEDMTINAAIAYVNITLRCGLKDKAKSLLQGLLEKEVNRDRRRLLISRLYGIEQRIDPNSPNLIELLQQFSTLCKQENEEEESQYLLMYWSLGNLRLTAPSEVTLEFQRRLTDFSSRFPQSEHVKLVPIPTDDPDELFAIMDRVTGMDAEKRALISKNERLIREGKLACPYALIPKLIGAARDLLSLWERAKIDGGVKAELRLHIATQNFVPREAGIFSRIPLIDDISLFVLFDLGLLQRFFDSFRAVAISRNTLQRIQLASQNHLASVHFEKANQVSGIISRNIAKVIQPPFKAEALSEITFEELQEYQAWVSEENGIMYSDDVLIRIFTGRDDPKKSICTMDLIALLRQAGTISGREATESLAKLCQWNVSGVVISILDVYNALTPELSSFDDRSRIEDIQAALIKASNFTALTNYTWDNDKQPLAVAYQQIATLLAVPIAGKEGIACPNNILSAILCHWYSKVSSWIAREPDPLQYFVLGFASLCKLLVNEFSGVSDEVTARASERIWKIFNDAIIHHYGNSMSDAVFSKFREEIAHLLFVFDHPLQSQMYNFIKSGLINGTHEYDLFVKPYNDRLIEIALAETNSKKPTG